MKLNKGYSAKKHYKGAKIMSSTGGTDRKPGDHSDIPSTHCSGYESGQPGTVLQLLQQVQNTFIWTVLYSAHIMIRVHLYQAFLFVLIAVGI